MSPNRCPLCPRERTDEALLLAIHRVGHSLVVAIEKP
jgi:hypothetical protein